MKNNICIGICQDTLKPVLKDCSDSELLCLHSGDEEKDRKDVEEFYSSMMK